MKKNTVIILLILLLVLAGYILARQDESLAKQRKAVAVTQHSVDSLKELEKTWKAQYILDTLYLSKWRTKWDTLHLPGRVDTLTKEVIVQIADSTIKACEVVIITCETRVALATERGDSAESAAKRWEHLAKGPFIRPAVELTFATRDWSPVAAAEITIGRSRLKVLGRLVVAQAAETCSFAPNVEAYSCSQPTEATGLVGLRYGF